MATIYKRGSQWWGRVQRQGRELRQSLKTTSEAVGRKRLAAWLGELERVAFGEKPRRTFDDLALAFIDHHLPILKPTSRRRYVASIAALTGSFEGVFLDEIASAALSRFEAERRKAGARLPVAMLGRKRPKGLTASTIRRDLSCLSSMFGYAIENEWTDANPVPPYLKRARKRGLREAPPRRTYLRPVDEPALLAAAADRHGSRELLDAIVLAIDTGLRREELLGLERSRVKLDHNHIRLVDGTKNAKPRNVPLLPRARDLLAQIPAQLRSPFLLVNPETGSRFLALNKGLAGACKRAGIERLTWHDLRRTCGCRLLQEHGMSMEEVSRWLGHSSIAVTEKSYAFLEEEHLQAAVGRRTKVGTRDRG